MSDIEKKATDLYGAVKKQTRAWKWPLIIGAGGVLLLLLGFLLLRGCVG